MRTLAALLRARTDDLARHLPGAIDGEHRGVHQGRVASRRLREALPVAGGAALPAARARKTLRQITRALGPVRELDVALAHLESGLAGARIPRAAVERVRAHVRAERERRRERMLARLARVDLASAMKRMERIAAGTAPRLSASAREALGRRVRARAQDLHAAIARAGTLYHPDRLHEVRIAAKKLRYVLEVASAAALAGVTEDLRLLKRAQEDLGIMHDYQILLEHVEAVSDATPADRPATREAGRKASPAASGLRAMAAAYDRECRKLHAAYLKMSPQLTAVSARLRHLDLKVRNTRV